MAAAAPLILGGIGGGAVGYGVATAVGLGVTGTAVATAAGAVVGASLMMPSGQAGQVQAPDVPAVDTVATDTTAVDTSGATGSSETTINDVAAVQEDVATQADTTVDTTPYTPETSVGTAGGGTAEAAAASQVSVGPAEDEAIDFYEKGRRSTILTTARGLLSEDTSLLRRRRGLVGQGLIA